MCVTIFSTGGSYVVTRSYSSCPFLCALIHTYGPANHCMNLWSLHEGGVSWHSCGVFPMNTGAATVWAVWCTHDRLGKEAWQDWEQQQKEVSCDDGVCTVSKRSDLLINNDVKLGYTTPFHCPSETSLWTLWSHFMHFMYDLLMDSTMVYLQAFPEPYLMI